MLPEADFILDSWWLVGRYNMFQCKYSDCIALEPFIMRVNRCSWREFNFFLLLLISNSILSIKCAQLSCNWFHFDFSYICPLFLFFPLVSLYLETTKYNTQQYIHCLLFTLLRYLDRLGCYSNKLEQISGSTNELAIQYGIWTIF